MLVRPLDRSDAAREPAPEIDIIDIIEDDPAWLPTLTAALKRF